MSEPSVEKAVSEYIALLDRTHHHAPFNTTHFVLRYLYGYYGREVVDAELERQFSTSREEVFKGYSPQVGQTETGENHVEDQNQQMAR